MSVAIFLSYNSLPLTTDTSTNIGETLFLFVIVFVYAMSFYFVFEKRISQSVRIVYLRETRIAINNSSIITQVSDLNCTFAPSEGRNPRFKNAFLAFTRTSKSPISKRRVETMQRSFCLRICTRVQPTLYLFLIYATAWGICFSVHLFAWCLPIPDVR